MSVFRMMRPPEQRLPTMSSELLQTYFGLTPAELGAKAREITERHSPQTQGRNTYELAEFIISKGRRTNNPYYDNAVFFKNNYDSNTCYICGGPITEGQRIEELEHLSPIVEALSFGLINQLNRKEHNKTMEDIYNTLTALGYLLEYARSHRCCNQLKSSKSFFTFDGNPPFETPYKINNSEISLLLKKIWDNVRGGGTLFQDPTGCKESELVAYFRDISKDQFIKFRKDHLIIYFFQPLLNHIYTKIQHYGSGSFPFAQLVMISNQTMSIDQIVWKRLGLAWTGNTVTKDQLFGEIVTFSSRITYDSTRKVCIFNLLQNTTWFRNCLQFYNKRREGRSYRKIDFHAFSRIINVDYLKLIDIIKNWLLQYGIDIKINEGEINEGIFGSIYMALLLKSQEDFVFKDDMIPLLKEMINNINKYIILNIYMYILYFDPLSNNRFPSPTEIEEFNYKVLLQDEHTGYFQIHEYYTTNVFKDLNYVITLKSGVAVNINTINIFLDFLLNGITQYDVALVMIDYVDEINAAATLINFGKQADEYNEAKKASEVLLSFQRPIQHGSSIEKIYKSKRNFMKVSKNNKGIMKVAKKENNNKKLNKSKKQNRKTRKKSISRKHIGNKKE